MLRAHLWRFISVIDVYISYLLSFELASIQILVHFGFRFLMHRQVLTIISQMHVAPFIARIWRVHSCLTHQICIRRGGRVVGVKDTVRFWPQSVPLEEVVLRLLTVYI